MNRPLTSNTATSPGRRARSRLRVRLPVKVTTLANTQNAVLADLSLSGARLSLAKPVSRGADVLLQWGGFEAFGRVNWVHDGMCGVQFADPITPKMLVATRDFDDAGQMPADRDMARLAAAEWVHGVRNL